MWLSMQPRWRVAIVVFVLLCTVLLFESGVPRPHVKRNSIYFALPNAKGQANSTLGFQKIISISGEDPSTHLAWRQRGLIAAANRTGVTLHIEQTHHMPDAELDFVHNITLREGNHPKGGSAKAWAAHTRVLRQIVNERISTALILEDDVDWEVDIKKQLAPSGYIASAIRRLSVSDEKLDILSWPNGDTYDVLWLGHCGMRWHGKFGPTTLFNITFPDDLVLPTHSLAVYDGKPFEGVPDGYRQVRLGSEVLCSLAYGITLRGAERLLHRLDNGGGHGAFDIELTDACTYGNLRCLTVNPEVMHDQSMVGGPGSLINSKNPGSAKKYEDMKPITWNLRYSARCNAGSDQKTLKQCLPERQRKALYG